MKALIILLFVAAGFSALTAQDQKDPASNSPNMLPMFYYDVLSFKEGEKVRADIFVQVPYTTLKFVKESGSFAASYDAVISFYDEKNEKLITEKSWTENVTSKDFPPTTSRLNFHYSLRSIEIAPGSYTIRASITDKDSKETFKKEDKFTVRDLNTQAAISDLLFVKQEVKDEKGRRIIPNVTRNVASETSGFIVFYELYSDMPKTASIKYTIKGANDKEYFVKDRNIDILENKTQVFDSISVKELSIGQYRLYVKVSDLNGTVLSEASKGFVSQWIGVPNTMEDLEKSVEQMTYIAEPDELDYIEDAETQEEMAKRYLQFWKSKDPNPATEENIVFDEYYRRVAYANLNFKHYREGWRTDMGMVYITLGPPNYIERHPFDQDAKPYEVWDYYDINQRFIFVDNTGFGDYRLYNPQYGSWFKYRQ